jgi:hypothetical protein
MLGAKLAKGSEASSFRKGLGLLVVERDLANPVADARCTRARGHQTPGKVR